MKPFIEKGALRVRGGAGSEEVVPLVVEEPLEIRINGAPYAVLMRTPGSEVELAAGFCMTEGIVDSFAEIASIGFCPDAEENSCNVVEVFIKGGTASSEAGGTLDTRRAMESRSSCGICGARTLDDIQKKLSPVTGGTVVDAGWLVALQYEMLGRQELFPLTRGGTHAAALAKPGGEVIVVREDLGRHNALDKVIGFAMINKIDLENTVALLSGRISFEMAQKALRAGIPVVAAVSAATAMAVELAERMGCTLIGRLRDDDMIIYTHPERVRLSEA